MQDELMLLWQQGASSEPDLEEVARLAAKATVDTVRQDDRQAESPGVLRLRSDLCLSGVARGGRWRVAAGGIYDGMRGALSGVPVVAA